MKVSRKKRRAIKRRPKRSTDAIEMRKAELAAQVAAGLRDAWTLVAIPADLARDSTLRFPMHPYGEPKPWQSQTETKKTR